jgi:hypothetical protein
MSTKPVRFAYNSSGTQLSEGSLPFLPIALKYRTNLLTAHALLDSGASVNVLPYTLGLQLGAEWEAQGQSIALGGNLANAPAKGIVLSATVAPFPAIRLVFAWSHLDTVPVILGQMNFFQIFNVRFIGAEQNFEVYPYQRQ